MKDKHQTILVYDNIMILSILNYETTFDYLIFEALR